MSASITLYPSAETNALVDAIVAANRDNKRLILKPGEHLTKPGLRQRISLGENGLFIKGTLNVDTFSSIKRTDHSIGREDENGALVQTDSNYGLFFIPAEPTDEEWSSITAWTTQENTNPDTGIVTTFEYGVISRGIVKIENLELNCNMLNQGLPERMPSEQIEHSAMLGFSGEKYSNAAFPGKVIFVAFESVILNNIRTNYGGYSDDVWISRGYFRPNIGKVSINNITSLNRVNAKRATISFSGLTQKVDIKNANIFKLEAEESGKWTELPGEPISRTNQYSFWKLKNIVCELFDLAAKGKAIFLNADNILSTLSTNIYQLGGTIKNSTFNMPAQPTPLNRLNALTFKKVNWVFTAFRNTRGNFLGIAPRSQYGETCSARFIENEFRVVGELITDAETEQHCLIETEYLAAPGNAVSLEFSKCTFDSRFGRDIKTFIAKVASRGVWKFRVADFMDIPAERALLLHPTATVSTVAGVLRISIP